MGKSYQRKTRRSRRKVQNLPNHGVTVDVAEGQARFQLMLPMSPLLEEVAEAIEALPEASREVILLHDVEGFRYQEIADMLSVPIGTVMSRLHRARTAIRVDVTRRSNPGPTSPFSPLRRVK